MSTRRTMRLTLALPFLTLLALPSGCAEPGDAGEHEPSEEDLGADLVLDAQREESASEEPAEKLVRGRYYFEYVAMRADFWAVSRWDESFSLWVGDVFHQAMIVEIGDLTFVRAKKCGVFRGTRSIAVGDWDDDGRVRDIASVTAKCNGKEHTITDVKLRRARYARSWWIDLRYKCFDLKTYKGPLDDGCP